MNIYILEDDVIQKSRLEPLIESTIEKNNWRDQKLLAFSKVDALFEAIKERGSKQLFFLDFEIKGYNERGLEVGKRIRQMDHYATIVFVTPHTEPINWPFRYQINAFDFIDKNEEKAVLELHVEEVIRYVYTNYQNEDNGGSFSFDSGKFHVQVPFKELLYIETSPTPHKVILYTTSEQMEFYGKLSDMATSDKRLFPCHRSFIVNPCNIKRLDKKERLVYMKNDCSCLVARRKVKPLSDLLNNLRGRRLD